MSIISRVLKNKEDKRCDCSDVGLWYSLPHNFNLVSFAVFARQCLYHKFSGPVVLFSLTVFHQNHIIHFNVWPVIIVSRSSLLNTQVQCLVFVKIFVIEVTWRSCHWSHLLSENHCRCQYSRIVGVSRHWNEWPGI